MEITKRTHYIPCLWSAFWNPNYYRLAIAGLSETVRARDQVVYSLNIRSNKITQSKVNKVHFEKNFGLAEISYESALRFCKIYHPGEYEQFKTNAKPDQYPLFLNFENILTGIEDLSPYRTLLSVIKRKDLVTSEEKAFLADFIFIQMLRSNTLMSAVLGVNEELGVDKFEYLVQLKWLLSSEKQTYPIVARIGLSQWYMYVTDEERFPLCDHPILVSPESIMVALSPNILLEVALTEHTDELVIHKRISNGKYNEFKQRTIGNTFREIIYSRKVLLQKWQMSKPFLHRMERMNSRPETTESLVDERHNDLWLLNAEITQRDWLAAAHADPNAYKEYK